MDMDEDLAIAKHRYTAMMQKTVIEGIAIKRAVVILWLKDQEWRSVPLRHYSLSLRHYRL